MSKYNRCQYCGCKIIGHGDMCGQCTEKLRLIRKIRAIVFNIKRDAERNQHNDTQRDRSDTQTIPDAASGM